jgi:hypothetical protein
MSYAPFGAAAPLDHNEAGQQRSRSASIVRSTGDGLEGTCPATNERATFPSLRSFLVSSRSLQQSRVLASPGRPDYRVARLTLHELSYNPK